VVSGRFDATVGWPDIALIAHGSGSADDRAKQVPDRSLHPVADGPGRSLQGGLRPAQLRLGRALGLASQVDLIHQALSSLDRGQEDGVWIGRRGDLDGVARNVVRG
jgi:hypothetical protein